MYGGGGVGRVRKEETERQRVSLMDTLRIPFRREGDTVSSEEGE